VRRIDLYAIASSHAKSSLIAVIPDADFGWVVDLWSPTRDIPGALASHREFVAGLRKFGLMPTAMGRRSRQRCRADQAAGRCVGEVG
jgi:hypothetical protein